MTSEEAVFSTCDYAQKFILKFRNPKLDQNVIDAIVVDFINYFAVMSCGMDLAMYTSDLREGKTMSKRETILQKEVLLPILIFRKEEYNKSGIFKSVNRNCHMNECGGKAKGDNAEAVKVIEAFINGYMKA